MGKLIGTGFSRASSNLYQWSHFPETRTISLTGGSTYTAQTYGRRGYITLTGPAVGGGTITVVNGTPYTFVCAGTGAQNITITPVNHPLHVQIQLHGFAGPHIWSENATKTQQLEKGELLTGLNALLHGVSGGAIILDVGLMFSISSNNPWFEVFRTGEASNANGFRFTTNAVSTGQLRHTVYANSVGTTVNHPTVDLVTGGKIGLTYDAAETKVFARGALLSTTAVGLTSLDGVRIGNSGSVEVFMRKMTFFDRKLTDAEMIARTT